MKLQGLVEVEARLHDLFWRREAPMGGKRSPWTKYVGNCLRKIFRGLTVLGRGGKKEPEYLVDFAGQDCSEAAPWRSYHGLILAAECEWNPDSDELWNDFIKLADVRADRRIFIGNFKANDWVKEAEKLVANWATHLKKHKHKCGDDEVLVMLFGYGKADGVEGSWIIGANGDVKRLRLPPGQ